MNELVITIKLELSEKLEEQIERLTSALVEGTYKYEDEDEMHYHAGDTSEAEDGPPGFDEEGDVAIAGMTHPLDDDGVFCEARLFDDEDGSSDEDEEYVAEINNAGITSVVFVGYRLRTSSTLFEDIYDTREAKLEGHIWPEMFPNCTWVVQTNSGTTDATDTILSADAALIGVLISVAGIIAGSLTGPPGWAYLASMAISWTSLFLSTGELLEASAFDYGDRESTAVILKCKEPIAWNGEDGSFGVLIHEEGSGGDASIPLYAFGEYLESYTAGGISVEVGERMNTAFMLACWIQNRSKDEDETDVWAKCGLEPAYADPREVTYSWLQEE